MISVRKLKSTLDLLPYITIYWNKRYRLFDIQIGWFAWMIFVEVQIK
jgi:hypothetical protein